jgi:dCTP deaminase
METTGVVLSEMILSDVWIMRFLKRGRIRIEPFSETNVQPASYDIRVGNEYIVAGNLRTLSAGGKVRLMPGKFALFASKEKISVPRDIAATVWLRSSFTRQGLMPAGEGHIDPGFSGHLTIAVMNAGTRSIDIHESEPLCSVEFVRLTSRAARSYSGYYQNSRGVTPSKILKLR